MAYLFLSVGVLIALTAAAAVRIAVVRGRLGRLRAEGPEPWCSRCGYSLAASPGPVCSECGLDRNQVSALTAADFAVRVPWWKPGIAAAFVLATAWPIKIAAEMHWFPPERFQSRTYDLVLPAAGRPGVAVEIVERVQPTYLRRSITVKMTGSPPPTTHPFWFDHASDRCEFQDAQGVWRARRGDPFATLSEWMTEGAMSPGGRPTEAERKRFIAAIAAIAGRDPADSSRSSTPNPRMGYEWANFGTVPAAFERWFAAGVLLAAGAVFAVGLRRALSGAAAAAPPAAC